MTEVKKRNIWYISKYVMPPGLGELGGRGYMIMCELARRGYQCAIITSTSNQYSNVPSFNHKYLTESRDGIKLRWVKTLKYSSAKSIRRVGSWLHFEWRLLLMPSLR